MSAIGEIIQTLSSSEAYTLVKDILLTKIPLQQVKLVDLADSKPEFYGKKNSATGKETRRKFSLALNNYKRYTEKNRTRILKKLDLEELRDSLAAAQDSKQVEAPTATVEEEGSDSEDFSDTEGVSVDSSENENMSGSDSDVSSITSNDGRVASLGRRVGKMKVSSPPPRTPPRRSTRGSKTLSRSSSKNKTPINHDVKTAFRDLLNEHDEVSRFQVL